MQGHARGWSAVGGSLLLAAASHGWILLLGAAVILGVTYLAAYVLLRELKDHKIPGATIITPFLIVKTGLSDYNEAAVADGNGTVARQGELKQDDGRVATHTRRKKRSAGKQRRGGVSHGRPDRRQPGR